MLFIVDISHTVLREAFERDLNIMQTSYVLPYLPPRLALLRMYGDNCLTIIEKLGVVGKGIPEGK